MIVGFPSAVKRFSSEVTVFEDNEIVMFMTVSGVDTMDETELKVLNLKLNENNGNTIEVNNLLDLVKLSVHCEPSSGLSYYVKCHLVQTISELI